MIAKVARLKHKLDAEVKKNKRTRMFTYMIIHDIKHPTESLISSLNEFLTRVKDQVSNTEKLEKRNKTLANLLRALCKHKGYALNENSHRPNKQQSLTPQIEREN